jgi:FkbM family methyltransferase
MHDELKKLNPQNVLDIGANVGGFYKETKAFWPNAKYFLIEGNAKCEGYLKETGQEYRICLLSDSNKSVDFYCMKNADTATGNSYYRELTDFYKNPDVVKMQTEMLDNIVDPNKVYDFIKIDVQGAELDVIQGGSSTFSKASYVHMEVAIEPYNENAPLWDTVISFMHNIGFKNFIKIQDIVHPINRNVMQHDVLFMR